MCIHAYFPHYTSFRPPAAFFLYFWTFFPPSPSSAHLKKSNSVFLSPHAEWRYICWCTWCTFEYALYAYTQSWSFFLCAVDAAFNRIYVCAYVCTFLDSIPIFFISLSIFYWDYMGSSFASRIVIFFLRGIKTIFWCLWFSFWKFDYKSFRGKIMGNFWLETQQSVANENAIFRRLFSFKIFLRIIREQFY